MLYVNKFTEVPWEDMYDHNIAIVPILSDVNLHWVQNRISFIYLVDLESNEDYLIGCNHNDLYKNGENWMGSVNWPKNTFCYNSKIMRQWGIECYDIDLCYWFEFNDAIDTAYSSDITVYHRWFPESKNVNDITPVVIWTSYCRTIIENFKECLFNVEFDKAFKFYNDTVLDNYYQIEYFGVPCDPIVLNKFHGKEESILYTEYYPFTSTGRPSNRFGGINFAALNKTNGEREFIKVTPPDNILLEFDYDSYHVRLVSNLIGYDLPDSNLHDYFGRQYFNKPMMNDEDYEKSKSITFRMLYGSVYPEYKNIKFFKEVRAFRKEKWKEFQDVGYVEVPLSKRKIYKKNFNNMSSNKLFNYILQAYETEVNSLVLKNVLGYLYERKSRLILYTYDSFLFNYHRDDGSKFLGDIKNILERFGSSVNLSVGYNYHDMKEKRI